jgi:hypothetical protein
MDNALLLGGTISGGLALIALMILPMVVDRMRRAKKQLLVILVWIADFVFLSVTTSILPGAIAMLALGGRDFGTFVDVGTEFVRNAQGVSIGLGLLCIVVLTLSTGGGMRNVVPLFRFLCLIMGIPALKLILAYAASHEKSTAGTLVFMSLSTSPVIITYAVLSALLISTLKDDGPMTSFFKIWTDEIDEQKRIDDQLAELRT